MWKIEFLYRPANRLQVIYRYDKIQFTVVKASFLVEMHDSNVDTRYETLNFHTQIRNKVKRR